MTTISFASSIKRRSMPLLACAVAALALSGCGDARRAIGLDRTSPDEFAVVSRAPLSMPPSMSDLARPRPGAPRPQEPNPTQLAAATVFGGPARTPATVQRGSGSSGEKALMAQAAAKGIDPGIRNAVDQETTDLIVADRRWVDRLLFWQTQAAPFSVVDPAKESQRLREAQAQGKALNEGNVPTIERKRKAPLEGLF